MSTELPEVVRAPAKLTVSLRLTGVRDDGFHLIDAEMVELELGDTLTFRAGDALHLTGPFAAGLPVDDTNLVRQALRQVGRVADVVVDKQIPAQGGLGGGSADAAAVLRWAGCDDLSVAMALGADVAFCLCGGRARVTGIGEILEPMPARAQQFILITPPLGVSTIAAYRAWDVLGGPVGDGVNDLEPAALLVEPGLRRWRDVLTEAAGRPPTLAGSGATWFFADTTPEVDVVRLALREAGLQGATVVETRSGRP